MPVFSIVMPCFNAAGTLPETLASIANQSVTDWELICVDDGSTDATQDVIASASKCDARIKLVTNPGKGPSDARNYGALQVATGAYIAFCDADDIWTPQKLADTQRTMADPMLDATFGQIAFFEDDVDAVRTYSTVPKGPISIDMLLGENPVCTMSNLTIRRASMDRLGGLDSDVVHNEDLEWLIRLVGQGGLIRGMQPLHVYYRKSPGGLSADLEAMEIGRLHAIDTAKNFGVTTSQKADAIHKRYLARRALRLGHERHQAAKFACEGFLHSPRGFMSPPRRGALTLVAALVNMILPRRVSQRLFAH